MENTSKSTRDVTRPTTLQYAFPLTGGMYSVVGKSDTPFN